MVQRQRFADAAIANALRRERQRQKAQLNAREQRFRVVNCLRSTFDDASTEIVSPEGQNLESQPSKRHITIVDIESQSQHQQLHRSETESSANQEQHRNSGAALDQQPADSDIGYVYDLYVPENEMQAAYVDMMDDNYLRFVIHIEPEQTFSLLNYYM